MTSGGRGPRRAPRARTPPPPTSRWRRSARHLSHVDTRSMHGPARMRTLEPRGSRRHGRGCDCERRSDVSDLKAERDAPRSGNRFGAQGREDRMVGMYGRSPIGPIVVGGIHSGRTQTGYKTHAKVASVFRASSDRRANFQRHAVSAGSPGRRVSAFPTLIQRSSGRRAGGRSCASEGRTDRRGVGVSREGREGGDRAARVC